MDINKYKPELDFVSDLAEILSGLDVNDYGEIILTRKATIIKSSKYGKPCEMEIRGAGIWQAIYRAIEDYHSGKERDILVEYRLEREEEIKKGGKK